MFDALKHGPFLRILLGNFLLTLALMVQEVVLGYELYRITKDPLSLGLLGLAEAVPFMGLALFGGHLADRRQRKYLMLLSLAGMLLGACVLAWIAPRLAANGAQGAVLWAIYGNVAFVGLARGIYSPAASSLRAQLVPNGLQANASAWSSASWQSGMLIGPVAGGFAYVQMGLGSTLWLAVGLVVLSMLLVLSLPLLAAPKLAGDAPDEDIWTSIRAGFSFVFANKILLYSITLDLVAVLFGGVIAILPAFALDVLHVGPQELGLLRTAPAVGAVLTMVLAARFSPCVRAWRNMLIAVTGFGVCTLVFALSTSLWLSLAMLALTGVFDAISVVIRQFLLQTVPPDHLRGRVLSVNGLFVSASNEIGAFESGVAAKYLGLRTSVLAGAGLTLLSALWLWRQGRRYKLFSSG